MIKATELRKSYDGVEVLKGVGLTIPSSQFVSIVGPSGAGKSTLLHILGGLDRPNSGSVSFFDTNIYQLSSLKQAKLRNQEFGFVFQFHHLLPEFTAEENVSMPLWIRGLNKKEGLRQAQEILDFVGLKQKAHHKPNELSGGEQQRVAIARALVTQPKVVFADEPTGNLDTANAQIIHDLFIACKEKFQTSIVMVTHNDHLATLTDRKITMKDGLIIADDAL